MTAHEFSFGNRGREQRPRGLLGRIDNFLRHGHIGVLHVNVIELAVVQIGLDPVVDSTHQFRLVNPVTPFSNKNR